MFNWRASSSVCCQDQKHSANFKLFKWNFLCFAIMGYICLSVRFSILLPTHLFARCITACCIAECFGTFEEEPLSPWVQLFQVLRQSKGNIPVHLHELHPCDKPLAEEKVSACALLQRWIFFFSLELFTIFFRYFWLRSCALLDTLKCCMKRTLAGAILSHKSPNVPFSLETLLAPKLWSSKLFEFCAHPAAQPSLLS